MRVPFFSGGSYVSRSPIADPEDCVNFLVERMEMPGARNREVLYPTPGYTSFCTRALNPGSGLTTALESPIRGMFRADAVFSFVGGLTGWTFFVAGDQVYLLEPGAVAGDAARLISRTGAFAQPIALSSEPVSWAYSGSTGDQIALASGGTYYYADEAGGSWTWNAVPALVGATILRVGFWDSFMLALDNASTLRISESFAGQTWDPLQIKARTNQPDPWVSFLLVHDQLFLFGTRTTDVFWNAGTSPFPFQPVDGVSIPQGIVAPWSVAELDNAPIWLGQNAAGAGILFRANGYTPERVSKFAFEQAISRYTTIADAEGESFMVDGHWFYVITFPTAKASWMYDASNGEIVKVGYWNPRLGTYEASRLRGHAYAGGVHYVGDRQSGTIYTMSSSVSTEMDGNGIRRMRRTPVLTSEGVRLFFRSLQVDLEAGLGLSSGQGSDPEVMLRWSDDGGKTWSNEHRLSAGPLGQYQTRAMLDRLGSSRQRVFELATSDPIPFRLVDAYIDVEKGLH